MIKEIITFNYSQKLPCEEIDCWFFEQHALLAKKLPHLIKYVCYRTLHLPKNDLFPSPQFSRMEERWWPSKEFFWIAEASYEKKQEIKDLNEKAKLVDAKRIIVEKEINILKPEMTGSFQLTMNEMNGKPHVKSLWTINLIERLSFEEAENWYLNHHSLLAARNFNLVRYVTYRPADDLGINHGFYRLTELWFRNWETMLNDMASPKGQEVLEDNKNELGEWRFIMKSPFMDYPHVVGNEVVFV